MLSLIIVTQIFLLSGMTSPLLIEQSFKHISLMQTQLCCFFMLFAFFSHFSLLLGCALPIWMSSGYNDRPLAPFSGILSLGIGDTMVSVLALDDQDRSYTYCLIY